MRPSRAYPEDFSVVANVDNSFDLLEVSNDSLTAFEEPEKTVFDLEEGDPIFILGPTGKVVETLWVDEEDGYLENIRIRGLIFLTRQEAKDADNQRIKENLGVEL